MSNDLVVIGDRPPAIGELVVFTERGHELFPTVEAGLDRSLRILLSIRSFDDIERVFLKGAGLSANTYRCYLAAVKDFYSYSEGLLPTQVMPSHIECWYDSMEKRVGRATARLRVAGLKRFFAGVGNVLPGYVSPFDPGIMPEKLTKKLNRTQKSQTKTALTVGEIRALLDFLQLDTSEAGRTNHAMIYFAVTSGLRASELCALTWGDLDNMDGTWTARFVGKGSKPAAQECYAPAVECCRQLFRARYRREALPVDRLFFTSPTFSGQPPAPMTAHVFWDRMRRVGKAARAAGVINREMQFSPHLLRRSYVTTLYKVGMGLKAIMLKSRHSNMATLVDHYVDDSTPATPFLAKALAS